MIQKTVAIYTDVFSGSSLQTDTLVVEIAGDQVVCLAYTHKQQVSAIEVFVIEEQNGWQNVLQDVRDYSSLAGKVFQHTYVYYNTVRALLVPQYLYNAEAARAFIHAVHVEDIQQADMHQPLPNSDAVLAWQVKQSLADAVQQLFPDAVQQHVYASIVQQATATENRLLLQVYPQHTLVALYKQGELLLVQTFETSVAEDVLYYALNALKQHGIPPTTIDVTAGGSLDTYPELSAYLQRNFPRLQWQTNSNAMELLKGTGQYADYHFSPYLHPVL